MTVRAALLLAAGLLAAVFVGVWIGVTAERASYWADRWVIDDGGKALKPGPPPRQDATIEVDGVPLDLHPPPRIADEGAVLVAPVRPIAEALGATVEWQADERLMMIRSNGADAAPQPRLAEE